MGLSLLIRGGREVDGLFGGVSCTQHTHTHTLNTHTSTHSDVLLALCIDEACVSVLLDAPLSDNLSYESGPGHIPHHPGAASHPQGMNTSSPSIGGNPLYSCPQSCSCELCTLSLHWELLVEVLQSCCVCVCVCVCVAGGGAPILLSVCVCVCG